MWYNAFRWWTVSFTTNDGEDKRVMTEAETETVCECCGQASCRPEGVVGFLTSKGFNFEPTPQNIQWMLTVERDWRGFAYLCCRQYGGQRRLISYKVGSTYRLYVQHANTGDEVEVRYDLAGQEILEVPFR